MYVKVYRYHVQHDQIEKCLDIINESDLLYKQFVNYTMLIRRSHEHPSQLTEIHLYESEEDYVEAMRKMKDDARVQSLFEQFLNTLNPEDPEIKEETYQKGTFFQIE
ncbi:hypothetical protein [Paenibacillus sp. 1001270B_150601_E10]|uniref:hypothetical protein n=1 Tax=Paenibacillus sp. 1001270B_150601_E10 TaxID=2787079 RepID=UPI00189E97D1|nr:hypothetical protein [Paenibacillus sp. 1001270B_150601_E10]